MEGVRLDKWLWAARFFKTRALAIAAIESGKVHVDGVRAKPAKEMRLELVLSIRRGDERLEVLVTGISAQRRSAPEAALLYEETSASQQQRAEAALHKPVGIRERGEGRPTKRQRRQIEQLFRE